MKKVFIVIRDSWLEKTIVKLFSDINMVEAFKNEKNAIYQELYARRHLDKMQLEISDEIYQYKIH